MATSASGRTCTELRRPGHCGNQLLLPGSVPMRGVVASSAWAWGLNCRTVATGLPHMHHMRDPGHHTKKPRAVETWLAWPRGLVSNLTHHGADHAGFIAICRWVSYTNIPGGSGGPLCRSAKHMKQGTYQSYMYMRSLPEMSSPRSGVRLSCPSALPWSPLHWATTSVGSLCVRRRQIMRVVPDFGVLLFCLLLRALRPLCTAWMRTAAAIFSCLASAPFSSALRRRHRRRDTFLGLVLLLGLAPKETPKQLIRR